MSPQRFEELVDLAETHPCVCYWGFCVGATTHVGYQAPSPVTLGRVGRWSSDERQTRVIHYVEQDVSEAT